MCKLTTAVAVAATWRISSRLPDAFPTGCLTHFPPATWRISYFLSDALPVNGLMMVKNTKSEQIIKSKLPNRKFRNSRSAHGRLEVITQNPRG